MPVLAPRKRSRSLARLRGSEGFRVDSADGRIGVVHGVLAASDGSDEPQALVVRSGLFHPRFARVAAADVRAVLRREHRVVVRTPTAGHAARP